ncbi:hypothetical protein [Mucilaginibacter dorajii]|uniref:Uncharacterized protein n=1 Tax=Mucilaginibacter dorajii TaxID=692994 RepID=A0ABP7PXF0_9SPHI|nr:hypothetical protein [Mucilaginibacter dorajii]MCS3737982.1 hypothetical protein [Mucilaginibacter dorajii]
MIIKFLNLAKVLFAYIDSGAIFRKPYKWLYMLIAVLHGIIPVGILISALGNHLFDAPFKVVLAFLLILIFITVASVTGMLLWWNRKDKLEVITSNQDDFVATPIFAHFIQTSGENIAIWLFIAGTGFSLIAGIFLSGENGYIGSLIPMALPSGIGFAGIVLFPFLGYFTLVLFRFLAEQIRALAAIANNTYAIAHPVPASATEIV